MDRKEAIKLLICEKACVEDVDGNIGGERVRQAYDMAIEALQAQTDGDIISRADAIEAVAQEWLTEASAESPYVNDDDIGEYRKLAKELFEDVPSAKAPTKCIAEIKIDADEVAQKIKGKYDLADRPSVAYICDGTACDGRCDECHHTTDIEHAKNFERIGIKYIEKMEGAK